MTLVRRSRPARTRHGAVLGAVLTFTVAAVTVLPGVTLSPAQAATRWQSGVYTAECGKASLSTFGTWRHAKVERTAGYVNAATWGALSKLSGLSTCLPSGIPITLSVAMLPTKTGTLGAGARGAYDKYWAAFGKTAVKDGYSKATLRIGWEMNGDWFKWNATKNPVAWKTYWRHIVNALRKVPGQHFTYEWSPGLGVSTGHFDASKAYPGNAYVTYIGSSVYDEWWGPSSATAAQRWNSLNREAFGLAWLAKFAKSHHKKVGISEWGLASRGSFQGHGDGDNAYFITHFYAWMKKSNVAYDVYFNRHHQDNEHRLTIGAKTNTTFTKAAAAYRKMFGGL